MIGLELLASVLLWGAQPKHRLFYTLAILAGTLLLAALIIRRVDRWRKAAAAKVASAGDQLAEFRELYEQGVLSEEEFNHIRRKLGAQLKDELQVESKHAAGNAKTALGDGEQEPPDWSIQVDKPDED